MPFLQAGEAAVLLLGVVDLVDEAAEHFGVAGAHQHQPLFLFRLGGRSRPVGEDDGVAEDVVAQLLPADAELLPHHLVGAVQMLPFVRQAQGQADRRTPHLLHERRIGQVGRVDAQVLHHETEAHIVGDKVQQFVARRRGHDRANPHDDRGHRPQPAGKRLHARVPFRGAGVRSPFWQACPSAAARGRTGRRPGGRSRPPAPTRR